MAFRPLFGYQSVLCGPTYNMPVGQTKSPQYPAGKVREPYNVEPLGTKIMGGRARDVSNIDKLTFYLYHAHSLGALLKNIPLI